MVVGGEATLPPVPAVGLLEPRATKKQSDYRPVRWSARPAVGGGPVFKRRVVISVFVLSAAAVVACGDDSDSEADATATEESTVSTTDSVTTDSVTADSVTAELIGSWHRAQTCAEMLDAFQQAGLDESQIGWLQGNFFAGEPGPTEGDPCEGALGPLEHDHFFTADGEFGSHDENGEEVDSGDFEVIDDDTVSFPSHASEFAYDGDLVVDYSVTGDVTTFEVALPDSCLDTCADAYAWALSAFASGPWESGEVP